MTMHDESKQLLNLSSILWGCLLVLFECVRGRNSRMCRCLYRQRHTLRYRKMNPLLRVTNLPPYPRKLLGWVSCWWKTSDSEFFENVGMDGYVMLRLIRLCKRLCLVATLGSFLVLVPIYSKGERFDKDISTDSLKWLTISNVDNGSHNLWYPTVMTWVFTIYLLLELRQESIFYNEMRNDWLADGCIGRNRSTTYTILIERIPEAFRSPAVLHRFFSAIFPQQVHSVSICLGLSTIMAKERQRDRVLQKLERAIIYKALRERNQSVKYRGREINAIEHYSQRLMEINQQLRPLQEEKLTAVSSVESLMRDEMSDLKCNVDNMALYFVEQLRRNSIVLDEKKTDMKGSVYRSRGSSAVADSRKATLDNENEKGALVTQQEKRKNIYSNNAINNLQGVVKAHFTTMLSTEYLGGQRQKLATHEANRLVREGVEQRAHTAKKNRVDRTHSWHAGGTNGMAFHSMKDANFRRRINSMNPQVTASLSSKRQCTPTKYEEITNYLNERQSEVSTIMEDCDSLSALPLENHSLKSPFNSPKLSKNDRRLYDTYLVTLPSSSNREQPRTRQSNAFFSEPPELTGGATRLQLSDTCSSHENYHTEFASSGGGSNNPDSPDTFNDGEEITDLTLQSGPMMEEQLQKPDSFSFYKPQHFRDHVASCEPPRRRPNNKHRRKRAGLIITNDEEYVEMKARNGGTAPPTPEDGTGSEYLEYSKKYQGTPNMKPGLGGLNSAFIRHSNKGDRMGITAQGLKDGVADRMQKVSKAVQTLTNGTMSQTGFVTFKSLAACTIAMQSTVSSCGDAFFIKPAPEKRDIIWNNIGLHIWSIEFRHIIVNVLLGLNIIFWSVVVSGVQSFTTIEAIDKFWPSLADYMAENKRAESMITNHLPVFLLLFLIQNLYFVLKFIASRVERVKSYSEVERSVMSRYFYYQLANIYVTVTLGSIFADLNIIISSPDDILTIFGEALPKVAAYFTNLITVKFTAGLMFELCFGGRPLKFLRLLFAEMFTDPRLRTKEARVRGAFAPTDPWYGRFMADFLLVLLIVFIYQCIAPFICVAGLAYFMFAEVVYTFQLMHVYFPIYESGGMYFYKVYYHILLGSICGLITIMGVISVKKGFKQVPFLVPLPLMVLYFGRRWVEEGKRSSHLISLDKAVGADFEDTSKMKKEQQATWETFDPFEYMQPSLKTTTGAIDLPDRLTEIEDKEKYSSDIDAEGQLQFTSDGTVKHPKQINPRGVVDV